MNATPKVASAGVAAVVGNERGVAIIVVMGMLLLLTILGTTMLASSTSDIKIAGNYRNSQETFYSAEAALSFGESFTDIYAKLFPGAVSTTWPVAGQGKVLDGSFAETTTTTPMKYKDYNQIAIPGTSDKAYVKVELVGSGKMPAGTGTQEDAGLSPGNTLKVNNFVVTVIAKGPGDNSSNETSLEAGVARLAQQ
ncbi:hypothetical protein GMLC_04200 [Geomonas limicola]|uniref:Type 4 fimbrial biogenesis protein PilX N-terminal domain-containing protein n=1 Tax=Geomonas limicola TaxID=2740186 RepID=A0A6V8N332_9BACT|nr:PilX N-terminal domain-containing pilus assembly protein [Geomonas limicola]GFO66841.1 hypothetical protein GMLC_04200 [Geomonas limicola]